MARSRSYPRARSSRLSRMSPSIPTCHGRNTTDSAAVPIPTHIQIRRERPGASSSQPHTAKP